MAKSVMVWIELPGDVAAALSEAAAARQLTPAALASECVLQQLEAASRYRFMCDRLETVDQALLDLARLVGELTPPEGEPGETRFDPAKICRYRAPA
jgi:hypothetical protein